MWPWVSHFICEPSFPGLKIQIIVVSPWLVVRIKCDIICKAQCLAWRSHGALLLLLYYWPIIIATVRLLHLSDPVKCSRESCKDYFTSLSVPLHFPTLSSVRIKCLGFMAPIYGQRKRYSCQSLLVQFSERQRRGVLGLPLLCLYRDGPNWMVSASVMLA